MTTHNIEIEGLPEEYEPVEVRMPVFGINLVFIGRGMNWRVRWRSDDHYFSCCGNSLDNFYVINRWTP